MWEAKALSLDKPGGLRNCRTCGLEHVRLEGGVQKSFGTDLAV